MESIFSQRGRDIPRGFKGSAVDANESPESGRLAAKLGAPVWRQFVDNSTYQGENKGVIQAEEDYQKRVAAENNSILSEQARQDRLMRQDSAEKWGGENGKLFRKTRNGVEEYDAAELADDPKLGSLARKSLFEKDLNQTRAEVEERKFKLADPADKRALSKSEREALESEVGFLEEQGDEQSKAQAAEKRKRLAEADARLADEKAAYDAEYGYRTKRNSDPDSWYESQRKQVKTAEDVRAEALNQDAQLEAQVTAADESAAAEMRELDAKLEAGVSGAELDQIKAKRAELAAGRAVIAEKRMQVGEGAKAVQAAAVDSVTREKRNKEADIREKLVTSRAVKQSGVKQGFLEKTVGLLNDAGTEISEMFSNPENAQSDDDVQNFLNDMIGQKGGREKARQYLGQENIQRTYGGLAKRSVALLEKQDAEFAAMGVTDPKERERLFTDAVKQKEWTADDADNVRQLSTGEVAINPARIFGQRDRIAADIKSKAGSEADAAEGIARLDAMRKMLAEKTADDLWSSDKDYQAHETAMEEAGISDKVQIVDAYAAKMKDRNGLRKLGDSLITGYAQGGASIYKTAVGGTAGLAAAVGADETAGSLGYHAEIVGGAIEDSSTASDIRGNTGGYALTKDLTSTVTQMAPMFIGGAQAQALKGVSQAVVGGMSVYGWAAAQGYESKLSDAISMEQEELGRDLTEQEIAGVLGRGDVQGAAFLNGAQTAILAKVLGKGVESAALGKTASSMTVRDFLTRGGREALKDSTLRKELVTMGKTIWADASDEFIEEATNQLLDGVISSTVLDKDMKLGDLLAESLKAGAMGALVGGGIPQVKRGGSNNAQTLQPDPINSINTRLTAIDPNNSPADETETTRATEYVGDPNNLDDLADAVLVNRELDEVEFAEDEAVGQAEAALVEAQATGDTVAIKAAEANFERVKTSAGKATRARAVLKLTSGSGLGDLTDSEARSLGFDISSGTPKPLNAKGMKEQGLSKPLIRAGADGSAIVLDEALKELASISPRARARVQMTEAQAIKAAQKAAATPAPAAAAEAQPAASPNAPKKFTVALRSGNTIQVEAKDQATAEIEAAANADEQIVPGSAVEVVDVQNTPVPAQQAPLASTDAQQTKKPGDKAKAAVSKNVERIIKKNPKLAAAIRVSNDPSVRATANEDGTVDINPALLVDQAIESGMNEGQAAQFASRIIDEEIRHLAQHDSARNLYAASGSALTFQEWRAEYYGQLWITEFEDTGKSKAVAKLYGKQGKGIDAFNAMEPWKKAFEAIRMMSQGDKTPEAATLWANIGENLRAALQAALDSLKSLVESPSPALKAEIDALEAALSNIKNNGKQGAGNSKNNQQKPAQSGESAGNGKQNEQSGSDSGAGNSGSPKSTGSPTPAGAVSTGDRVSVEHSSGELTGVAQFVRSDGQVVKVKLDEPLKDGRTNIAMPIQSVKLLAKAPGSEPEWVNFPAEDTLGIPRALMPQIKADNRSALVQFLRARGIEYVEDEVSPADLLPSQAEFSPAKVQKAREFEGGNRALLVDKNNRLLDGHHQWMAALDNPAEKIRVIRFDMEAEQILPIILEMPTVEVAEGSSTSVPQNVEQAVEQKPEPSIILFDPVTWTSDEGRQVGVVVQRMETTLKVRMEDGSAELLNIDRVEKFDANNDPVDLLKILKARRFEQNLRPGSIDDARYARMIEQLEKELGQTKGQKSTKPKQEKAKSTDIPELTEAEKKAKAVLDGLFAAELPDPSELNPVANKLEAQRFFADGKKFFAIDEMTDEVNEVTSLEMLNNYASDQLGWMDADGLEAAPLPESYTATIPQDRFMALMDAANSLFAEGVTSPEKLAETMQRLAADNKAVPYTQSFWFALKAVGAKGDAEPDWSEIYAPAKAEGSSGEKEAVMASVAAKTTEIALKGEKFTKAEIIEADPNKVLSRKELDESIEAGITAAAHKIAHNSMNDALTYQRLVKLYDNQPALTAKTSTSKINQAYSTPAPMAFVAGRLLGIDNGGGVIVEPTAGHGMLLMGVPDSTQVFANEIDPDRINRTIASVPDSQSWTMSNEDGTKWKPEKPATLIISNPPFGSVMDDSGQNIKFNTPAGDTTAIDHAIMLKQLENMAPDGRAVFIIGGPANTLQSEAARKSHYARGSKAAFFKYLHDNYGVVDHFTVNGDLYSKQGAGWNVDIITIQGKKKSRISLPSAKAPRMVNTWNDLYETTTLSDEDRIQLNRISEEDLRNQVGAMSDALAGISKLGGKATPSPRVEQGSGETGTTGSTDSSVSSKPDENQPGESQVAGELDGESNDSSGDQSAGVESRGNTDRESGSDNQSATGKSSTDRAAGRSEVKESGKFQAEYTPFSGEKGLDTLLPKNMVQPVTDAFTRIKRDLGEDLTGFVREQLGYPKGTDITKYLAGEQIDAVAAAIWNFQNGGALIIGDQTGIGKGRIAAALMKYAVTQGYIPVFMTKDPGLHDAMLTEDLPDIDGGNIIPAVMDTKLQFDSAKKKKLNHGEEYFAEIADGQLPGDANAIFVTYSQLTADDAKGLTKADRASARNAGQAPPDKWRMAALRKIAPNAVFILDESHLASGQSTTGWRVADIIRRSSRVYYSSATSVKRPDNMGIYFKTNVGKLTGGNMTELTELMNGGGVPAMQVVSSMLAQDGQYLRRERSFDGVKFGTQISVDTSERDTKLADNLTGALREIVTVQDAMRQSADAINSVVAQIGKRMNVPAANRAKLETTNFSSKLHNIVSQYLLAIKTQATADTAIREIKAGKKVVVALQSTMESAIDALEFGGFDMSYKGLVLRYLDQMRFLESGKKSFGKGEVEKFEIKEKGDEKFEGLSDMDLRGRVVSMSTDENGDRVAVINDDVAAEMMRRAMWDVFERARDSIEATDFGDLPLSPIDAMRQAVEMAGIRTGEITGRKRGIDENGEIYSRPASDTSKPARRVSQAAFNNEDLDFLVINQSGSTGISLHASEKAKNKATRVMIVAQPNLDINEFMQTLGRIHRSGQVVKPEFILLQTDLPAEKRPAAILGRKMAMLNANTTSNAKTDVSEGNTAIDIFNQYGDEIVYQVLERDLEVQRQLRPLGSSLDKFFDDKTGNLMGFQDAQKLVAEQPDGYIARTVTGYLAILPVEEQQNFWEKTLSDYEAYITYLDQIGQNALEAKAVDLQATTISSEVFTQPLDGDSAFAAASYVERVETKVGRKPLSGEEAKAISAKGRPASRSAMSEYIAKADKAAEELADKKSKRALKPWTDEKRSEFLSTQRAQRNVIANAISLLGRFGNVNRDDNTTGLGVIEEIKMNEESILTPSKQIAIIRVNDSRETIKVPVTQLAEAFTPAPFEDAKEWDDTTDVGGEAAIITGNLMMGMKALGGSGKVITYTTDTGETKMGILLPKTFLAKREAMKARKPVNSAVELSDALDSGVKVSNGDKTIKWSKSGSSFILAVPASRANGGSIWRNPVINRLSLDGEFTQVSNQMRASFNGNDVQQVMDILKGLNETFSTDPDSGQQSPVSRISKEEWLRKIDEEEGRSLQAAPLPKLRADSPEWKAMSKEQRKEYLRARRDGGLEAAPLPNNSDGQDQNADLEPNYEIDQITGIKSAKADGIRQWNEIAGHLASKAARLVEVERSGGSDGEQTYRYAPEVVNKAFTTRTASQIQRGAEAEVAIYPGKSIYRHFPIIENGIRPLTLKVRFGARGIMLSNFPDGNNTSIAERVMIANSLPGFRPEEIIAYGEDGVMTRSPEMAGQASQSNIDKWLGEHGYPHAVFGERMAILANVNGQKWLIDDLHNENFRVAEDGKTYVTDFTAAKLSDEDGEKVFAKETLEEVDNDLLAAPLPSPDEEAAANVTGLRMEGRKSINKAMADEARKQQELFKDEGKVVGAPRLANPGDTERSRSEQDVVDALYEHERKVREDPSVMAEARKRLEEDERGVEEKILQAAYGDKTVQVDDSDYVAVRLLINKRAAEAGNNLKKHEDNMVLRMAYRLRRADLAREMRIGRDLYKTPAERHLEQITDAIYEPKLATEKKLRNSNLSPQKIREEIRAAAKARVSEIEKALKKMGVTLDEITSGQAFLSLSQEQILKDAMKRRSVEDQYVIKLIQKKWPLSRIRKTTGMTEARIQEINKKLYDELMEKAREKARAGIRLENYRDKLQGLEAAPLNAAQLSDEEIEAEARRIVEIGFGISPEVPAQSLAKRTTVKKSKEEKEAEKADRNALTANWSRPIFTDGLNSYEFDTKDRTEIMQRAQAIRDIAAATGKIKDLTGKQKEKALKLLDELNQILGKYGTNADKIFQSSKPVDEYRFDINDRAHVAAVARAIRAVDADIIDKGTEWTYSALLSGLQTMMVNAGAAIPAGWDMTMGRAFEAAVNLIFKDPMAATFGESKYILKAAGPTLARAWSNAAATWGAELPMFDEDFLGRPADLDKMFDGKAPKIGVISGKKGRIIRIPTRMLMATDDFNRTAIAVMEVGAMAYRLAKAQGMKPGTPEFDRFLKIQVNTPGSLAGEMAAMRASKMIFTNALPGQKDAITGNTVPIEGLGDLIGAGAGLVNRFVTMETDSIFTKSLLALTRLAFVPFQRTPFNIIRRGIRHTLNPVSMLDIAVLIGKNSITRDKETGKLRWQWNVEKRQAEIIERASQQLQGGMLMLALFGMAAGEGDDDDMEKGLLITGTQPWTPKQRAERAAQRRAGIDAYRISFRGKDGKERFGFSYGRIEPLATTLGLTVDTLGKIKLGAKSGNYSEAALSALGGSVASAQEKTYLAGISDFFTLLVDSVADENFKFDNRMQTFAASRLAMVMPNIVKQPLREADPYYRDKADGFVQEFMYQLAPYGQKEVKMTPYGEKEAKPGTALSRIIDIGNTGTNQVNPIDEMLLRFNAENPGSGWFPSDPQSTFTHPKTGEKNVKMTPGQAAQFKEMAGKRSLALLKREGLNLDNPTERDIEKAKAVFTKARSEAKKLLLSNPKWLATE